MADVGNLRNMALTCGNVVGGGWQLIAVCELLADCVRTAGSGRSQATESKWSLSPRALATFMMVAKLGFPAGGGRAAAASPRRAGSSSSTRRGRPDTRASRWPVDDESELEQTLRARRFFVAVSTDAGRPTIPIDRGDHPAFLAREVTCANGESCSSDGDRGIEP